MLALALLLPPQHVRPLAHHNYREALWKSLLFFRAQRSGDLGPDNPIPWRSAPSFASDGADVGVNLSRGYFDAGDYVKYAQPAAFTLSLLSWGALEFERGLRAAGALAELRAAVRWGADFILQAAAHVERRCTYYAQVGRGAADRCARPSCKYDHGYWGRAEEYASYEYARQRRTYSIDADRPGTEAWAGASAALAAAHQLLARDDPPYAARLLQVARKLFSCATAHNPLNAKLQEALPQVSPQYTSWGFSDELGWAAAWLYDATHEEQYADAFKVGMRRGEDRWWYEGFAASWDDVNALAKLKMLTAKPGYAEAEHLRSSLLDYIRKWRKCSGETRKMTACGLCYAQKWGSLRYAMTSALVAAVYATHFPEDKAEGAPAAEWASGQLHYLLGDNSLGRSYMIGYAGRQGQLSYPRRPHHRGASCPPASEGGCDETALCDPCDSPWVLHGAVVGGPDETDCWNDDRSNWERNEVALDYSAPLPGLLAWMLSLEAGDSEKRWPAQLPLSVAVQSHGVLFRQPQATRGVFESLGGSPLAVGALLVLGYLCYSYRQRASFQRGRGSGRRSHIHFKSMPPRDVEIDSDMQDSFSDPNEFSQPKGSSSYTSLTSPYLQNSTFGLQEEEGLTFGLHPRVDDEHEVVFRTSVSPRGHIEMRPPGTAVSSELSPLHRHTECPVFRSRRVIPSHPIMGAQVMWWYSALAQAKEQVQSNDARALGSPSSQAGAEWATSAELD
ncbi:hypothetical protein AB1Y20_017813 [Prymnesium parvum]|uniref:cellulase n=1 Tax=Prymnesium parvum TaxID=97485 RepID=A0AB34JMT1_PRYPA